MWLAVILAAVVALLLLYLRSSSAVPPNKKLPPGNPKWYQFYEIFGMFSDFKNYSLERKKKHGNIFRANILFNPYSIAGGGQKFTEWWAKEDKHSINPHYHHPVGELIGKNVIATLTGEPHTQLKKKLLVSLVPKATEQYVSTLCDCADKFVKEAPIVMSAADDYVRPHVFFTMSAVLLGEQLGPERYELLRKFHLWVDALGSIPINLPFTKLGRGFKAMKELEEHFVTLAHQRPRGNAAVDQLLDACEENGAESEINLGANMKFLLGAAHETTASVMSSILMVLHNHKGVNNQLMKEISSTFPGESDQLDYQKVKSMKYLDALIKETIRMYPAAPILVRRVEKDSEVDGYFIPKGYTAVMLPYITHYDETLYPNPHEFKPERFLENTPPRHSFFGFGDGLRQCIGMELAKLLLKVFTIQVMRKMTWHIENVRMNKNYTLTHLFDIRFVHKI